MKIYHVCECCDKVYKVTESVGQTACVDLTGDNAGDIMMGEPEYGSGVALGLCDDCREEIYGSADHFFYSSRIT